MRFHQIVLFIKFRYLFLGIIYKLEAMNLNQFFLISVIIFAVSSQVVVMNIGCKSLAADGSTCLVCSAHYYMDSTGICQPVSATCKDYNNITGACIDCYGGYYLVQTICIFGTQPSQNPNPYCSKLNNTICSQCYKGYFLQNNTCSIVNPLCKTFDYKNIVCTDCFSGYSLSNGSCIVTPANQSLSGCTKLINSICIQCSVGYYFDVYRNCVKSNSLCKTYDPSTGNCLSCYSGFKLLDKNCSVDASMTTNPYCQKFVNSTCVNCSSGYYFDSNNICQQVDPLCKIFDYKNDVCTTCYIGFSLNNGSCTASSSSSVSDINCKSFDSNNKCLNCSSGFYFNGNNICTQVDPNCKIFNFTLLQCTVCYNGYSPSNGSCIVSPTNTASENTCAQWLDSVCVKCIPRAYYDFNANCVMVSDSCNTFNSFSGQCTSCYGGFALNNGNCQATGNNYCATYDPNSGLCIQCYNGTFLNSKSICTQIDPQCEIFNYIISICTKCYKGYAVNLQGVCSQQAVAATNVQNCVQYDNKNACTKCFNLYYLSNNVCVTANPLCKTFNVTNGNCLTCYTGFTLSSGLCNFS